MSHLVHAPGSATSGPGIATPATGHPARGPVCRSNGPSVVGGAGVPGTPSRPSTGRTAAPTGTPGTRLPATSRAVVAPRLEANQTVSRRAFWKLTSWA